MEAREERRPERLWTERQGLAIYVAIGVLYVVLGVFIPELLFSWWEGVPFLVLGIWIVHTVWQRRA